MGLKMINSEVERDKVHFSEGKKETRLADYPLARDAQRKRETEINHFPLSSFLFFQ